MALITNSVTFTVGTAAPVRTTTEDLLILTPSVPGALAGDPVGGTPAALRLLTYPGGLLAPIIYESNPDVYSNFNISPLDKRPRAFATTTLSDNVLTGWLGMHRDVLIKEQWQGSTNKSRMTLAFFQELQAYYENPPTDGTYITWAPRDRTATVYNIVIESLTLSLSGSAGQGAGDFEFDYIVTRHGYVAGTVALSFYVIGAV